MKKAYLLSLLILLGAVVLFPTQLRAESEVVDWTGAYVGANFGGAFGRVDTETSAAATRGGVPYLLPLDFEQIAEAGDHDPRHPGSVISGGQVGYNYQSKKIVMGLETDFQGMDLEDTMVATREYLTAPGTSFSIMHRVRAHWLCTVRPRIGVATNRWLVYGTTGMAFSRIEFNEEFSDTFTPAYGSAKKTKGLIGWALGGGLEYAIAKNWSVKAEYLFINCRSISIHGTHLELPANTPDEFTHRANLDVQTVRLGVNFKF